MKFSKILLGVSCLMLAGNMASAQETCPLPIMVKVENADGLLSEDNEKLLTSKLKQLVATSGFGSDSELSHLCLVANVSETGDKQVITANRPIVAGTIDVYMVVSNLLSGENFGAENIALKATGNTDAAMIQSALAQMAPSNAQLQRFVQNSRVKVFDYYRSHIPSIITQSRTLSQRGDYDKALYLLSTVPPCVEGYDSIGQELLIVYDEYLNVDCHEKLSKALSIWRAAQDEAAAQEAAAYIAAIDYRSECYDEALALLDEISDRIDENLRRIILREDEDRELAKELVRDEMELKKKQLDNDFLLRQQEIDAIRDLSQGFAKGIIGGAAPSPVPSSPDASGKGAPIIIIN